MPTMTIDMAKTKDKPSSVDKDLDSKIQGQPLKAGLDMVDATSLTGSSFYESRRISYDGEDSDDFVEGSYFITTLHNVENPERYEPGGFHPVHIGDYFCDKRYKVIHKLGNGGFSTVWLARDTEFSRYVSLKIVCAEASKECQDTELEIYRCIQQDSVLSTHLGRNFVYSILDHFWFDGPNGSHICLVSPVLGPSMARLSSWEFRLHKGVDRKTGWQVTQGLAYLHSLGICHGDLTPSNILFELAEINSWSEETIYAKFGHVVQEPVRTLSGEPPEPHAPTYLVNAINIADVSPDMITDHVRIVDLGQSFRCGSPHKRDMGIPFSYMAPELLFEKIVGPASDLWALGCTLYEIRAGRPLLDTYFGGSPEDTAYGIAHTLGPFPTAWDRITFGEEDGKPVREEDDTKETMPWLRPDETMKYPLVTLIADIDDPYPTSVASNIDDTEKSANMVSGRKEILFWRTPEYLRYGDREKYPNPLPKIPPEEVSSFYDLLVQVLKYQRDERMEAAKLATHGWFHSRDTSV